MSTNGTSAWKQRLGIGVKKYDNLDIVKGFIAFVAQVLIIASGSLLINNQMKMSRCDPEEGVVLNYTFGSILIVVGSLMVLYSIFLMIRPTKVA